MCLLPKRHGQRSERKRENTDLSRDESVGKIDVLTGSHVDTGKGHRNTWSGDFGSQET